MTRKKQGPTPPARSDSPAKNGTDGAGYAPFTTDDGVMESAVRMFGVRGELLKCSRCPQDREKGREVELKKAERAATAEWHGRLRLTPPSVALAELFTRHRLNRLEREAMTALLLDPLGLWPERISDVADVVRVLALPPSRSLAALRCLSESGRLLRKGLAYHEDPDEDLRERDIRPDPAIIEGILEAGGRKPRAARLSSEKDLVQALAQLARLAQKKHDALYLLQRGCDYERSSFMKWRRRVERAVGELDGALAARPAWALAKTRGGMHSDRDWLMFLVLAARAQGHVAAESPLCTGAGLARAATWQPDDFEDAVRRLFSHAPLLRSGLVQPCGGTGSLFSENEDSVRNAEFELTDRGLAAAGLEKARRLANTDGEGLREPRIALSDLVLPPGTAELLGLAVSHVRGASTLMEKWGLGRAFAYGRGVTLLFHGPPGTGKTATAEAVARELGRLLFVADYSKIQNCYVGQTEKNIVSAFARARREEAVLFWDEADAMFFDRDGASRAWEVRDVNVLLQEIERFEGVCILATNRKAVLDKALERRIMAKVEFPRPDRALRASMWRVMLPAAVPLATDVDIAALSANDLSGGEIKNVILNACRMALGRSEEGPVTMADFQKAVKMETTGAWSRTAKPVVGFKS